MCLPSCCPDIWGLPSWSGRGDPLGDEYCQCVPSSKAKCGHVPGSVAEADRSLSLAPLDLGSGIWEEPTARDLSFGGRLPTPQFWEEGVPLPSFRALGCTSLGLDAFLVPLFCAHGTLQAFPPGVQRRMVPHKKTRRHDIYSTRYCCSHTI